MNRLFSFVIAVIIAAPLMAQTQQGERILLPVFTPPVHGAFGSEFHTDLRVANNSQDIAILIGLQHSHCPFCPPDHGDLPYLLNAGDEIKPEDVLLNGTPGRFLYVGTETLNTLSMNLRVYDVNRDEQNFGTEIPIVRESDFATNRIDFVGVPTDPRFRNTLRIYSPFPGNVLVTVGNHPSVLVALKGGISFGGSLDLFNPAYAMFTNFPVGSAPVRVTVEKDPSIISLLPIEVPLWAFITVTNNDTQVITTITPQP